MTKFPHVQCSRECSPEFILLVNNNGILLVFLITCIHSDFTKLHNYNCINQNVVKSYIQCIPALYSSTPIK